MTINPNIHGIYTIEMKWKKSKETTIMQDMQYKSLLKLN